jgi:hypothetical protein
MANSKADQAYQDKVSAWPLPVPPYPSIQDLMRMDIEMFRDPALNKRVMTSADMQRVAFAPTPTRDLF